MDFMKLFREKTDSNVVIPKMFRLNQSITMETILEEYMELFGIEATDYNVVQKAIELSRIYTAAILTY